MCRDGQCKNSMMSAGHRFTSLRGIIIVVYAIEDGKSMSCGHLCFFYFTFPAHLRYAPMYRVTQKSVSYGHPLMPPDSPLPLPTSPLSPPDIHISHLCCIQPIGVVHSAEVVRTVAIIYRGTYRGLSEWQMRVSAGHRFLRNPVHRSAAKMCRGGQCKNSMMSAGHRFTSLRGIIIVVYAIEDGKSMSCGHLCFFYFTFPAHLRYAPMYRVTQKSVSCGHPLMPPDASLLLPASPLSPPDPSMPLPAAPLTPPDIHICVQPTGVVHSAEVVRSVAIIYRGTYRGRSGWQTRVSAGHRFLRNPVHRSVAEMCRDHGSYNKSGVC